MTGSGARSDLATELARREAEIAALGRLAHLLAQVDAADRTMEAAAEEGMRLFGAERAGVFLFDEPGTPVRCVVARGLSPAYVDAVRRCFRDLPSVEAVLRAEPFFVTDARNDPRSPIREEARREGVAGVAALPLVFGDRVFGALSFYHNRPREYPPHEQRLARAFADQAALAIGKSRLVETVTRVKREWQAAFDGTGNGLALVDAAGRIERANRFMADLARVAVTDLPGLDLRTLFARWPSEGRDPLAEARRRGGRWSTFLDTLAGQPVVLTATPRPDGGYVVAVDDLTAYVRLEARYSRVVETVGEAILLADPEGRVTSVNRAGAALFGQAPEALAGLALDRLLPDDERPEAAAPPPALRRYETLARVPDGVRLLAVSIAPLEERGAVAGWVAVARDVTAERLATEALRRSERRYRALFRGAPLAMVTLDRDGSVLAANRAALRMAGLGRRDRGLGLEHLLVPEDRDRVLADLRRSHAGDTREFVFRFRPPGGAVRQGFAVSVPIEEREGRRAVLAIARDITDEVALRERLSHSEKLAALGVLVSGIAHELNNPLAGIAALAQSVPPDGGLEEAREALAQIRLEAVRAARIVQGLLGFARQRPLDLRPTDLNRLAQDALRAAPGAADGVAWGLDLAPDLPPVPADPDQIRQVLTNLLTNAAQAMANGSRRQGAIRTWADRDWVCCRVEDSGPGIAPDTRSRIFEPFFTTKPPGAGTGLGLSLSHGIVRAHGGEIEAANGPDGGAWFTFRLPRDPTRVARSSDG
ncbi:MAG TPA: PAS domain S-box protein [Gemmatimonadales bacterium]|jgi:PAS domain S-box-containing protein|nr:PAS domain S-box protein [Gemmatimonadales bacterium]